MTSSCEKIRIATECEPLSARHRVSSNEYKLILIPWFVPSVHSDRCEPWKASEWQLYLPVRLKMIKGCQVIGDRSITWVDHDESDVPVFQSLVLTFFYDKHLAVQTSVRGFRLQLLHHWGGCQSQASQTYHRIRRFRNMFIHCLSPLQQWDSVPCLSELIGCVAFALVSE